ncbi:hypothetical protein GGS23DRAFT_565527 [Durotheca rogersii]|uniref:uncharacterized protein n=1 Tax=Durotheca rogersii TaxID=419775 RepID=UPI00221EAACD|nr:uncharacterized protein GGS23DRAFT_565527 [Durotheca rogersii]KAI5863812.1 hypothetical protein GGS23DRAFT_565527 [Durotheca rogersii]
MFQKQKPASAREQPQPSSRKGKRRRRRKKRRAEMQTCRDLRRTESSISPPRRTYGRACISGCLPALDTCLPNERPVPSAGVGALREGKRKKKREGGVGLTVWDRTRKHWVYENPRSPIVGKERRGEEKRNDEGSRRERPQRLRFRVGRCHFCPVCHLGVE